MKKVYALLILLVVVIVAIWIFIIIAGESEEAPVFGESYTSSREPVVRGESNSSLVTDHTNGTKKPKKPKKPLSVVNLAINQSTQLFNYPEGDPLSTENVTVTKIIKEGESMWDVLGKTFFHYDLPSFLEKRSIYNSQLRSEVLYSQSIVIAQNITLNNFTDDSFRDGNATFGFNLSSKQDLFIYKISFITNSPLEGFEGEELFLMGKNYYIQEAKTSEEELVLLESPYILRMIENHSYILNYPLRESIQISIEALETNNTLVLSLDNETTSRLQVGSEAQYNNLTLFIKEILYDPLGNSRVVVVISPTKVILKDNTWIQRDGVVNEEVYFEMGLDESERADELRIAWSPQEKLFVAYEHDIVFPIFETITVSVSDWAYYDPDLEEDPYVHLYFSTEISELFSSG